MYGYSNHDCLLWGIVRRNVFHPDQTTKETSTKNTGYAESNQARDKVVTIGGLHGIVEEINSADNTVVLDCEGIFLTFEKRAISRISKVATITTDDAIVEDFTATETEQTQEDNNEE